MATIYDVATQAGVSPATVSRVLSGKTVNAVLTKKVRAAAKALGYRANRTAQSLRRQHSKLIGLIIPDIENSYFTAIARGVEDALEPAGYSVVLCNSDSDLQKESRYVDVAVSEAMAGIIIAPANAKTDLSPLLDRGRAVVVIDRDPLTVETDVVVLADRASASELTNALFELGHERIACVTGPADVETSVQRVEGWRDAHRMRGIDPAEDLLVFSDFKVAGGQTTMQRLLDLPNPPDAVFSANNLMGAGMIETLEQRRQQVGLAVFGPLPAGAAVPRSCVISGTPGREMGRLAAERLLARIVDASTPMHRDVLEAPILPDTRSRPLA
ncbi:LacI family DNA-binding transcriptional regulator [Agrococcus casei]|uniref:Ribose operon repressor n=1 Tax=Agrococcus casei LMG 22410 TaxID=1255656 RepID=A0A1R4ETI2_9MICO|nr:LacI family DNA-binding transcriptional regulator [Agrococcus casei]SJM46943.1 Ribose operon repressor [Agrococcus casei LMG 22410]